MKRTCQYFLANMMLLASILSTSLLGSTAAADQLTVTADRDAYNDPWALGNPSTGANPWTLVDKTYLDIGGWGDMRVGFIHFNTTGLPSNVANFVVSLYCLPRGDSSTNTMMDIWIPTTSWNENVCLDKAGPSGYNIGYINVTPTPNQLFTFDLAGIYNNPAYQPYLKANGIMLVPRATNNNFNVFASSEYSTTSKRPKLVVNYTTDANFRLSFPLADSSGFRLSPYTTRCVGIPDLDESSGKMKSHRGEIGSGTVKNIGGTSCYPKQGGGSFNMWPLSGYDDGDGVGTKTDYLCYDNHKGHDYPAILNTPIYAAANGLLAVGVNESAAGSRPDGLWRNKTVCPDVTTASSQWDSYHALYIIHQGGYSTWYLHLNSLDDAILGQIKANGFAQVVRGQLIGYVGHFGAGNSNHLHFGVKKNGTAGNITDPYGNGTTGTSNANILWDVLP